MWIRRLFQTGILFAVLWLSALGVIRARPYDDAAIRAMLGTDDCVNVVGAAARPCFMGILVGVTVRDEALAVLAAHPWVDEISESGTVISWSWSGAQPGLIDASQDGLISLSSNGRTRQMRILTRMEFGDVWLSQGAPDSALLVRPVSRSTAYQISYFTEANVQAITTLDCPSTPTEYWSQQVSLGRGELWNTEYINGVEFSIYNQPAWWTNLRRCRPMRGP
ncbi:MAG: hypothetical protein KME04_11625 [Pleurocapsa minor GSE-CHR-MK-17-07R]|jgi:hypothetical protein|nr:hypothetical protein [Pleurocapsa minor GSE-CHR-MK 17-07R]